MDTRVLMAAALSKREHYFESKVSVSEASMDELVPAVVQDAYSFIDIVYSVRNPAFNIPHCTTMGRFTLLLQTLCSTYGSTDVAYANPLLDVPYEDRVEKLSNVDWHVIESLDNLLVCDISTTTEELTHLPSGNTGLHFTEVHWCIPHISKRWLTITYRTFRIDRATKKDKEVIMRMKASCLPRLSPRVVVLLGDPVFPLCSIPGCTDTKALFLLSSESDQLPRHMDVTPGSS